MKKVRCSTWIWKGVATLGVLALVGAPISGAVAQDAESANSGPTTNSQPAPANASETNVAAAEATAAAEQPQHQGWPHDVVEFGHSTILPANEVASDMVVIGGSATALGKVEQDLVAIFGNVMVGNEAGGDAVAVMGNVRVGTNAVVHGDTVAVLGNIKMGPGAKVYGDVVSVGGAVERGSGSEVHGEVVGFPGFSWLGDWLEHCAFKLRPLAPHLGWLWAINGVVLLIYLLIAIAFPRPVQACVDEIARRPVTTVLLGLLTKILLPLVFLILVATGIGVFVVPFLVIAAMVAGMIGKVALLQYLGRQIGGQLNVAAIQRPVAAFLLGWVLITILYLVPVLGFIVYFLAGMWAIGAVVMAMFSGRRREMPDQPTAPPAAYGASPTYGSPAAMAAAAVAPMAGAVPIHPVAPTAGTPAAPATRPTPPATAVPGEAAPTAAIAPPPALPELLSYPRAGFWERMGAGFLDLVLVGILSAIVGGPPLGFIVALAYFTGMWAWKGTTVGGIVLKLQVVRSDGQPVSFLAALVRALAAAFSMIVLFLGFLWMAWDRDKQGWHDKIAGTVVVRLPRSVPLVCV